MNAISIPSGPSLIATSRGGESSRCSARYAFPSAMARMAPISTHIVHQLLVDLRLDRLAFHHTMIDTAIVAKEVDKGTGLAALRDWVLAPDAETIAVGDEESDLAMFRVATRSFAPSNIGCRRQARLFGCQIAHYPYQRGLLEIVHNIVHADGGRCERCRRRRDDISSPRTISL